MPSRETALLWALLAALFAVVVQAAYIDTLTERVVTCAQERR